jgi:ribosomal protein L28
MESSNKDESKEKVKLSAGALKLLIVIGKTLLLTPLNDKSKEKVELSASALKSLTVIGMVLLLTPIIVFLLDILTPLQIGGDGGASSGEAFCTYAFEISGFILLVYVTVKRFQKGLKGK